MSIFVCYEIPVSRGQKQIIADATVGVSSLCTSEINRVRRELRAECKEEDAGGLIFRSITKLDE